MTAAGNPIAMRNAMPWICLSDAPWQREALQRLAALWDLHPSAPSAQAAAVRAAPQVIEYFEQAPVLLRACAVDAALAAMCAGQRLKIVMAAAGLAMPLRKLTPEALRWLSLDLAQDLSRLPPSLLAQSIPLDVCDQIEFATAARVICNVDPAHLDLAQFRAWAIQRAAPEGGDAVAALADYVVRGHGAIDYRWSWDEANRAIARWHVELGKMTDRQKFERRHGVAFDAEVETPGFPPEAMVEGYQFVALRSGAALQREGKVMHHCVASYAGDVITGKSRIFAMTRDGKPVATVEYRAAKKRSAGEWFIAQVSGPCNARVAQPVRAAAERLLAELFPKEHAAAMARTDVVLAAIDAALAVRP